jgi:transposase-like protein
MNKKELEAFAKQAAKSIKSEADLTDFRKMLTKVTVEAALNAELDEHLGYSRHEQSSKDNYRNGYSSKTIRTEYGEVDLDAPRDRDSSFEPQLVKKNQTRNFSCY